MQHLLAIEHSVRQGRFCSTLSGQARIQPCQPARPSKKYQKDRNSNHYQVLVSWCSKQISIEQLMIMMCNNESLLMVEAEVGAAV